MVWVGGLSTGGLDSWDALIEREGAHPDSNHKIYL